MPPDQPDDQEDVRSLAVILRDLCAGEGEVTIGEIVEAFGRRAFGALLLVFSVPNLLPLPPGSSTVLGAPLVLLAPQVAIGVRVPWLPKGLKARRMSRPDLRKAFDRLIPWLDRIEQASRPRLTWMFGSLGDRLIGLACTLLALVLILPIPFGNMLPAATVGVLSLALIQRDGVLAIIGYGLFAASVGVLVMTANVALEAAQRLMNIFGL
jgi:hypothetical protein